MLIRETRRLIFIVIPVLIFSFAAWKFYKNEPLHIDVPSRVGQWIDKQFDNNYLPPPPPPSPIDQGQKPVEPPESLDLPQSPDTSIPDLAAIPLPLDPAEVMAPTLPAPIPEQLPETTTQEALPADATQALQPPAFPVNIADTHDILNAISSANKSYFKIKMGDQQVMNPNIIPHPSLPDTWIIVAQQDGTFNTDMRFFTELYCNAQFVMDGRLMCIDNPTILPVEATLSDKCTGNLAFAAFNVGPHDARVFYGPQFPMTMYGSQSSFACFGLWAQDLRELIPWGSDMIQHDFFTKGTEIQRPLPWGRIEKNFFLFWDEDEHVYAHHDIVPKRVFAQLKPDGSVGPDLAPMSAQKDDKCLAKYLPKLASDLESIHQATNSLSVTLCKRSDPACKPTDENTVVFTIYQHKKFYSMHALYEPYVMAFRRKAPFEIYGMSQKPFWISGRVLPDPKSDAADPHHVAGQEMMYIVSMSWKKLGQKYHGFLDDEMFLSFGIEDHDAGAIDIKASDLFLGLSLCE